MRKPGLAFISAASKPKPVFDVGSVFVPLSQRRPSVRTSVQGGIMPPVVSMIKQLELGGQPASNSSPKSLRQLTPAVALQGVLWLS